MITPDGSLKCDNCKKEILLKVTLQEGQIAFYCPRCHHYQEVKASTAQVTSYQGLTKPKTYDTFFYRAV